MFDIRDPFMNYYELLDYCFNDYIREFGERKFEKIKHKIKTSNRVGRLIKKLDEIQAAPASDNLIWTVNEILYFNWVPAVTDKSFTLAIFIPELKSGKAVNYGPSKTFTLKKATYLADVHFFFF